MSTGWKPTPSCTKHYIVELTKTFDCLFVDFVVGAPYEEGGGAIYLYLGGPHGVHYHPTNGYWQRIAASDFPFALEGFGISVSSADVDSNGYPGT